MWTKFETGNTQFDDVANEVCEILIAELDEDGIDYHSDVCNTIDRVNNKWVEGDTVESLLAKCR